MRALARSLSFMTALLLGLALAPPASAATIVARDIPYLTQVSDAVVHGTVTGVRYSLDEQGRPWTHTQITVEAWWKGEGTSVVEVSQLGGPFGDGRELKIEGDLALTKGTEVVLFLTEDGDQLLSTLLSWSAFEIVRPRGLPEVRRHGADLGLTRWNERGELVMAKPHEIPVPRTLTELRKHVRYAMED